MCRMTRMEIAMSALTNVVPVNTVLKIVLNVEKIEIKYLTVLVRQDIMNKITGVKSAIPIAKLVKEVLQIAQNVLKEGLISRLVAVLMINLEFVALQFAFHVRKDAVLVKIMKAIV